MKLISNFLRNQGGGTAIIAALTAVPLAIGVAGAVDMVRANRVQTILQGAADAAALAGAVSKKTQKIDYNKIVQDYLVANGGNDALSAITKIDSDRDETTRQFTVWIEGKVETGLLGLIGISEMNVGTKAVVGVGGRALEVALVLDNTGSMAGTRITALKAAAHHLVNELMIRPNGNADVKIGVVPFSEYVNVGLSARTKTWINVDTDTSISVPNCGMTYPNVTYTNCVNTLMTSLNDGVPFTWTNTACDTNLGAGVWACNPYLSETKWNGCVGSRNSPLDESIGSLGTKYPGVMNASCPAEIVPLTNSAPKVTSAIDALITTGSTYIPAGLVWGWNMLEPDEPVKGAYSKGKMTTMNGTKSIILMTDGANTMMPIYPHHSVDNTGVAANAITANLCANIKADGIKIYTVAFEVTDATTLAMLNSCASDGDMAFVADNATALMASFDTIAEGLSDVRLIE